jgi:hypothetical protein
MTARPFIFLLFIFLLGCDSHEPAESIAETQALKAASDTLLKKKDSILVKVSPPLEREAEYKLKIKQQANEMNNFLLKHNFKSFAKYAHPALTKTLGGEKEMISALKNGFKQMEEEGNKLISIQIDEPAKVISIGEELQSILTETLEMSVPRGKFLTKSVLIAISKDGGKHWYFIDTSGKSLKKIQSELPGISDELIIPPPEQAKLIETK